MALLSPCKKGVGTPPSLLNIFKELKNDVDGFTMPKHGDLSSWARQGVFLLNTTLTVRKGAANSHAGKGWEKFTDETISQISKRNPSVVFMLWGNHAQKKQELINSSKHLVLKTAHPSPLSCQKFFGCRHFSKANEFLVKHGQDPIDWNSVNTQEEGKSETSASQAL